MYTPIEQSSIDQKIHNFMARKSPAKTLSRTLAERLSPSLKSQHGSATDIAYEKLDWHQSEGVARTSWQNAL